MEDCIFCKIMAGEIPTTKIHEDELCFAFKDIEPLASQSSAMKWAFPRASVW